MKTTKTKNDDESEDETELINYDQKWLKFIAKVAALNDPLVHSVFKQARFIAYASDTHLLSVELSKDFVLFKEWLDSTQSLWQPLLRDLFSMNVVLDMQFTGVAKITESKRQAEVQPKVSASSVQVTEKRLQEKTVSKNQENFRGGTRYNNQKPVVVPLNKNEARVDISDENRWKTAAMLMRHFPGTVTEIRENNQ